jgi:hypothetical protein
MKNKRPFYLYWNPLYWVGIICGLLIGGFFLGIEAMIKRLTWL